MSNISKYITYIEGFTVSFFHWLLVILSFILGIYTTDWFTLMVITINLLIILALNIYIQDCPLSKMERDRLGTCLTDVIYKKFYKNYNSDTRYVIQTGAIIFMLTLICIKGLVLLFKRNIKLFLVLVDQEKYFI